MKAPRRNALPVALLLMAAVACAGAMFTPNASAGDAAPVAPPVAAGQTAKATQLTPAQRNAILTVNALLLRRTHRDELFVDGFE